MASLDVFRSDLFGVLALTTAMNKMPYKPARLGEMGIFKKQGINTTNIMIEEQNGKLMIVPSAARGSAPNPMSGKKRQGRTFTALHLPLSANVMADDVQNVRAFGSESEVQSVADMVNDKIADMRQNFEATHEWHRINSLQGILKDADGSTIYNWYTEFGITAQTVTMTFGTPSTNNLCVKLAANAARRIIEDNLGMDTYTNIHAIVGATVMDQLVSTTEIRNAYIMQKSEFLRASQARGQFEYAGVIWEEYRGSVSVSGTPTAFFPADQIWFFPEGADIFQEVYAPANFVETVNTKGLPTYAKQERMKFDLGIEIFGQSNPLILCNRPACLVQCTPSGTPV